MHLKQDKHCIDRRQQRRNTMRNIRSAQSNASTARFYSTGCSFMFDLLMFSLFLSSFDTVVNDLSAYSSVCVWECSFPVAFFSLVELRRLIVVAGSFSLRRLRRSIVWRVHKRTNEQDSIVRMRARCQPVVISLSSGCLPMASTGRLVNSRREATRERERENNRNRTRDLLFAPSHRSCMLQRANTIIDHSANEHHDQMFFRSDHLIKYSF